MRASQTPVAAATQGEAAAAIGRESDDDDDDDDDAERCSGNECRRSSRLVLPATTLAEGSGVAADGGGASLKK